MRKKNVYAYGSFVVFCVCGLTLLMPLLFAWAGDPDVSHNPDTHVVHEDTADSSQKRSQALIDEVAKAGNQWRSKMRDVNAKDYSSAGTTFYLNKLVESSSVSNTADWRIRVRICLELLQRMPNTESMGSLRKLAESRSLSDSIRTEALVTIYTQPGGVAYVEEQLHVKNDQMRAAAVRAVSRIWQQKKIKSMVERIRKQEEDLTGTHTGQAIEEARTMLDVSLALSERNGVDAKLQFLLQRLPYEQPPPPSEPFLASDPVSAFVWKQLLDLWQDDPVLARKIIEGYGKTSGKKQLIDVLLDDCHRSG
jgi:hypothetical protein